MNHKVVKIILLLLCVMTMSSCKDEIKLKESSKTLYRGEVYEIELTSKSPISYSVLDDFIVGRPMVSISIDSGKKHSRTVQAKHVGSTQVIFTNDEDTKVFYVTVAPRYHTYAEPQIAFGDTKSQVIAALGTPDVDLSSGIGYANYSNNCQLIITFENDMVANYTVVVPALHASELTDFLIERYELLGVSDGISIFYNHDKSVAIAKQVNDDGNEMVTYLPFPQTKSLAGILDILNKTGLNSISKKL